MHCTFAPRLSVVGLTVLCAVTAPAVDYTIAPGPARLYLSETKQEVSWASAGDTIQFTSSLATSQAWKCIAVADGVATVQVTILRVLAKHKGPGSEHGFDSGLRVMGPPDALLGHLKALDGVTLTFAINLASGQTAVTGGEKIAANIAKRAPNMIDPQTLSPVAAQAVSLYSDTSLSRTWSQVLARPQEQPQMVPLGEPLLGTLLRSWSKDAYTLSGEVAGAVVLAREPAVVTAQVSEISGSGSAVLGPDGWPSTVSGALAFTLSLDAITQPVVQQHRVTWQLARLNQDPVNVQ